MIIRAARKINPKLNGNGNVIYCRRYYAAMLEYITTNLLLYPYHLEKELRKHCKTGPFQFYIALLMDLIRAEKSYDALPNFTAADCLRLCGIGRNEVSLFFCYAQTKYQPIAIILNKTIKPIT